MEYNLEVLNVDKVKEEIMKDNEIKNLLLRIPPDDCSTNVSPMNKEALESFISSVGFDKTLGKVNPQKVLMILKKEMIKFIMSEKLKIDNMDLDVNNLITELSDVSQNYEEIIANDFGKFTGYMNMFSQHKEKSAERMRRADL